MLASPNPVLLWADAGGYNDFSPTVRDFWAVVGEFSREERGLLLKFVTSCSKPPLLGFAHMQPQFTIQCVSAEGSEMPSVLAFLGMGRRETGRLPTSATCFNLLKLPNFKSKKLLRDKLCKASPVTRISLMHVPPLRTAAPLQYTPSSQLQDSNSPDQAWRASLLFCFIIRVSALTRVHQRVQDMHGPLTFNGT